MKQSLSAIERLEIECACVRVVHAYVRALDLGDLSGAADFFAKKGSFARPTMPAAVIQGREAIRAALMARPKTLLTKHLTSNVMIDVVSRDEACGLSYLTMISTTQEHTDAPHPSAGPIYFGEIKDRFIREDGEWKILERRGSIQIKFLTDTDP